MARKELEQSITHYIRYGYYIVSDSMNHVTLKKDGQRVNHAFHLILTLFTAGFWVIFWLLIAVTSESDRYINLSYDKTTHQVLENNVYKGSDTSVSRVDEQVVDQMIHYKRLLNEGILSEEEYEAKKNELLG